MRPKDGIAGLSAAARREHALRNALSVLELSLSIARDALEHDDAERAVEFIARAEQASRQCRQLFAVKPARGDGHCTPA